MNTAFDVGFFWRNGLFKTNIGLIHKPAKCVNHCKLLHAMNAAAQYALQKFTEAKGWCKMFLFPSLK